MAKRKLTAMVDESIYNAFVSMCNANDFKVSEVINAGVNEPDSLIALAVAKREQVKRESKEAQILKLSEELGYTEADFKKLLKSSKPAKVKPAKEKKVLESRRAHKGTYEDEAVVWEVDKYGEGYFCRTKDSRTHKKDVNGKISFPETSFKAYLRRWRGQGDIPLRSGKH